MTDGEREFVDGFLRVARAAHPGFWIQGQWDVRCAEDHNHKSGFCGMGKTAPVGIDPTYRWNIAFRDGVDLIRTDSDPYGFMVDEPDLEFIVWCANHRNQIANALEATAALTYHFPGTQTPSFDDVNAYTTNRLPHHRDIMEGKEKP